MNYNFILADAIYLVNILKEAFDNFFAEQDFVCFFVDKNGENS